METDQLVQLELLRWGENYYLTFVSAAATAAVKTLTNDLLRLCFHFLCDLKIVVVRETYTNVCFFGFPVLLCMHSKIKATEVRFSASIYVKIISRQ